mgnify:CR=1 FL=1
MAAAKADAALHAAIATAGFAGAELTVEPFRSGAMNELLPDREKWRHA